MNLSKPEILDGFCVLKCFENNDTDKLVMKRWQSKVWEVYFYKHNRMFYVTVDNKDCYVLHACKKQKNKTEKTDSEIVIKRAKELGKRLNKNFI